MNKETKVGLFVVTTLIILYVGFNYLKGINLFSPANRYYALYNNIDQLSLSSPVLINGYTVGRVSNIEILQRRKGKILVELDIDADIILGDSTVAILSADFLGNKSILLNMGNIARPLERGDTLYTEVAKGIFDMFTEQAEPVANNIQVTLRKLDVMLDMLVLNSSRLDTLFARLVHTPTLINNVLVNGNNKINDVSSSAIETADNLSIALQDVRPLLKNLGTFSDSLTSLRMGKTLVGVQKTLLRLTTILAKTSSSGNTLGRLMTEDSLYVNLNNLLLRLDTLIIHFEENPRHFLAPLGESRKKIIRKKIARKKNREKEKEEKEKEEKEK